MNSVITEITDYNGGQVFYDATCTFCTAGAHRAERVLKGRGFVFRPLPAPAEEMQVLTAAGETLGGAAALAYLARRVWWTWPLWMISRLPGTMGLLTRGYRRFAAKRHCRGKARRVTCCSPCKADAKASDWTFAGCAVGVAVLGGAVLPPWAWMWSLAATMYLGFKWITWIRARRDGLRPGWLLGLGYWLLWPGMSPKTFARVDYRPRPGEWIFATAKTVFGATLVWAVARRLPGDHGLLVGWVGLVGLAFLLHFGVMHLAALMWRVEPIMRAPMRATSLRDFWSTRWNTAFRDLAQELWFAPLRRRWGVDGATFGVFVLSGAIHELVISVPASAGFGLPTMYFTVQGLGMLIERRWRRRAGGFGWRLMTWIIVVGPAFWLFHPPFIERVVVPFLRVIRAID